jgi:hypothetical protein
MESALAGRAQASYRCVNLVALALEVMDLVDDLLVAQCLFDIRFIGATLPRCDEVFYLGQSEAKFLSLQDRLEAAAVRWAVKSVRPVTTRLQQAAVFVESQSAQADSELARKLADRRLVGHLSTLLLMRNDRCKRHAHRAHPLFSFLSLLIDAP